MERVFWAGLQALCRTDRQVVLLVSGVHYQGQRGRGLVS